MYRAFPPVPVVLALALLAGAAACGEQAPLENEAGLAAAPAGESKAAEAASAGEIPVRRPSRLEEKLVPPGAVIGADPDPRAPTLVFQAKEEPADLLDWLRATGNGADFVLESEMQEGAEHVFSGRVRATGGAYTVRVAPGATGGTTGMVMVTAR